MWGRTGLPNSRADVETDKWRGGGAHPDV